MILQRLSSLSPYWVHKRILKFLLPCKRYTTKVNVGDYLINYEEAGHGNHVVFCMPGALGTAQTDFAPQMKLLSKENFTMIAWDPPGYGQSRPPARKFDLDFFHRDAAIAAQLLKVVGHEKYSVLGWSDGAITALILAGTFREHVNKLIVVAGSAYISERDMEIYNKIRDINQWSEKMRKSMEDIYGKELFKSMWEEWIDVLSNFLTEKGGDICKEEVKKITCPTLIVQGAKDFMVPMEHAEYLKSNIKNSRLYIMEEGKHNLHLRYADEFNKLVKDFLNEK